MIAGENIQANIVFRGKLICNECGRSYAVGSTKILQTGEIRRSYRCRTRTDNGPRTTNENGDTYGCNSDIIYEDVIKEGFKSILKDIIKNKEQVIYEVQKIVESTINKREKEEEKGNILLKRKKDIEEERQKAIELCIKGLISEEELEEKRKDKEKELQIIEEELKKEQEELKAIENKKEIIERSKEIVNDIVDTKTFSDEVCRTLIDKVIVYSKSEFDFYLKGRDEGEYFKKKGVLLYNNHGIK